jgi:hypothetical protein
MRNRGGSHIRGWMFTVVNKFVTVTVVLLAVIAFAPHVHTPSAMVQARRYGSTGVTYIHEFPHPRVVVHYHPDDRQFLLEHAQYALDHEAHALELDLQYRERDRAIVCNHDSPTDQSPTLRAVIELLLRKKGRSPTVYNDHRQFFLVLEPKNDSSNLLDGVFRVLGDYEAVFSTAVAQNGQPRGITVVITGASAQTFYFRYQRAELNLRCIVEGHDYSSEIVNLSKGRIPFQWVSIQHDDERARVNKLHNGIDRNQTGKFNVRVWDGHDELPLVLASGADSVNCDQSEIESFKQLILSQKPRGASPSLVLRGSQALLTWRGASSRNLYLAVGNVNASGLIFPRQIALTYFLEDAPQALTPACALTADGRLVIVYEGTSNQRLWYVSGRFLNADRFLSFSGGEHRLTLPDDRGRRGSNPSVAVGPDGRVVFVYEGTDNQKLWYVSGYLNENGELIGNEYSLTEGESRRGYTPSIAIDSRGRVIVAYRGTDNDRLWYVSGALDAAGRIVGTEFSLTEGSARRGYTPSVAIDNVGRVIIVYRGTSGQKLWYVTGFLNENGKLIGSEYSLTEGEARRGKRPTAGFDDTNSVVILYEGTSDAKLWYVKGRISEQGNITGVERMLDMSLDRR